MQHNVVGEGSTSSADPRSYCAQAKHAFLPTGVCATILTVCPPQVIVKAMYASKMLPQYLVGEQCMAYPTKGSSSPNLCTHLSFIETVETLVSIASIVCFEWWPFKHCLIIKLFIQFTIRKYNSSKSHSIYQITATFSHDSTSFVDSCFRCFS